jgi:hypothetical protein
MRPKFHNNGSDDEGSTDSEGVGDKHTRGRDLKTRHLKRLVYTSNSFVSIHDKQQNVAQTKCYIKHHKTEFLTLKMAQVHTLV